MRRSMILVVLAAAALLVAINASAADNGFYLGGSVGQASFTTGDLGDVDFNGDTTGYKVFAGGRFITFLGVEGSYVDFGEIDDARDNASYRADVTGYTLQGVAYLPLGIADIFVKGGMFQWDADLHSTIEGSSATFSTDGSDPVYGAGFQFRIQSFAIRGEVEYYDVQDADELYMYSVGASYTF